MLFDLALTTLALTAIIAARYLLVAGIGYWLLWGRGHPPRGAVRLNRAPPSRRLVLHELRASLLASPIYALPAAIAIEAWKRGGTAIYTDVFLFGPVWGPIWLVLSAILYLLLHDTFYYWLHRAMHRRAIFPWAHRGHHLSREPSPFASFSFDPAEAAATAWFLPALAFLIPIHAGVALLLLTVMTVSAVLNHSGFELLPARIVRGPVGRVLISASHHSLHHTRFSCNYGLYFRFWDRAMGTDMPPERALAAAPKAG